TNVAASSNLRYGTTPAMVNEITNTNSTVNHSIDIDGLDVSEFYYVQAFSNNGITTVNSATKIFSTASNSSGQIKVYFNHGVNEDFSNGALATDVTGAAIEAAIISRINNATTSIDCAIYNINRTTIVAALTNAHNNGIVVRYIHDDETNNLALQNPSPPFSTLSGNPGNPLMHHKFFVFDAESENSSYVIMGSTNMTDNNIADDFNNLVIIQDKAIAKAYTWEFNEMWGSEDPTPGIFNVKFGEDKTDNTPHLFSVNGKMVESYFSPSDNTALGIIDAVESADVDLQFAILSFTYNELGAAVLAEHNAGTSVRGIINNPNDQGSEFQFLLDNGVNVSEDNVPQQTHHKYCVIDATAPSSDPIVVTGSHNWSAGADVRNDENTLIFHNENIANIFLQEFEARWCEATGGANCINVATEELNEIEGFEATLFPSPATDYSTIKMNLQQRADVTISLWDFNGRMLQSSLLPNVQGEQTETLLLAGLATGTYVVTFKVGDNIAVKQLQVVK
ncbi:MAG: phosphatidylserine/phosphatidylglycerophosphate/cardiolipin synthase-like enzyme, partial [Polaribacter sp.]